MRGERLFRVVAPRVPLDPRARIEVGASLDFGHDRRRDIPDHDMALDLFAYDDWLGRSLFFRAEPAIEKRFGLAILAPAKFVLLPAPPVHALGDPLDAGLNLGRPPSPLLPINSAQQGEPLLQERVLAFDGSLLGRQPLGVGALRARQPRPDHRTKPTPIGGILQIAVANGEGNGRLVASQHHAVAR